MPLEAHSTYFNKRYGLLVSAQGPRDKKPYGHEVDWLGEIWPFHDLSAQSTYEQDPGLFSWRSENTKKPSKKFYTTSEDTKLGGEHSNTVLEFITSSVDNADTVPN